MKSLPLSLIALPKQVNRLVLAYSGGLDSSALLHALSRQSQYPIKIWHINHGLQNNAQEMELFAREQADIYNAPCRVDRVQLIGAENLEARAREVRYQLFRENLSQNDALLTAHHMNDQAETFLLHLLRGSGPEGLSAMTEITSLGQSRIFRPLLNVTRQQLEDYAAEHQLSWIDDASNQDTRFDRNFLRHRILPMLSERWPSVIPQIHRVTDIQQEAALLATDLAQHDLAKMVIDRPFTQFDCLRIDALDSLPDYRKKNVIRHWILEQGYKPFGFRKQQELLQQLDAETVLLEGPGYTIRKFQGALYLVVEESQAELPILNLQPDFSYVISDLSEPVTQEYLLQACGLEGGEDLVAVLYLRNQLGCPPGFAHRLKRLYAKHKIPPWQRDQVPLIYVDGELRGLLL